MLNVDLFFVEILRLLAVAWILLGASMVVLRFLKQPVERIRLIQISLITLLATVVIGAAGVVPKIKLPVLARTNPHADVVKAVRTPNIPQRPATDSYSGELSPQSSDVAATPASELRHSSMGEAPFTAAPASETAPVAATSNSGFEFMPWFRGALVFSFLFTSLLNVIYLLVGFVATRRLIRIATPLTESAVDKMERIVSALSIPGRVRFASSGLIDVPMVSGIWRPTILLPEALTRNDANPLDLKHSITHEWAHVARHDLLTWQLASLCQPFLWMQPCYWIMLRELRLAQDQLADQFATEQSNEHTIYAAMLVQLSQTRRRMLPGALTMAGGKSNLYRRAEMILNERFQMLREARKVVILSAAVLIVAVGCLLTSLELTHAATPILDAASQPGSNAESKKEDKTVDKKEEAKIPAKENAGDSAKPTKSAEHSGVVIDADTGKPIAGVTVTVTRMISSDWSELAVTKSLTDEDGKYTFTIPPDQLSQALLYIMFDVDHPEYARRHCGSYGYGMIVSNLAAGEQPWFSKLKMVQGEKIVGRLMDEKQRPVAGAHLRCETQPKSGFDRDRSSSVDGVSDQDGRFALVVPRDGITKLSIIPTSDCMKFIEIGEKRGDLGDVGLESGFPIQGVVRDAKGNPIEGVWVNITPEDSKNAVSYEMKRSSKTNTQGQFTTRPVKSGKYTVQVESKATGAPEKEKYANFHDEPLADMFVEQTISVTEDSARKPFVIQAIPHVLINVQHYKPDGEVSNGHSPSLSGEIDGRRIWIRAGKKTAKGAYQLIAPHGLRNAQLQFTTNEHSALMVQFERGKLSPQDSYRFPKLEEDINNIRVVRHPAAILKIRTVDESGADVKEARVFASYAVEKDATNEMMTEKQIGSNLEGEFLRLSSIVPNTEIMVRLSRSGFEDETQTLTMNEGERRTITVTLKPKKAAAEQR